MGCSKTKPLALSCRGNNNEDLCKDVKTLDELVKCYEKNYRKNLQKLLDYDSFEDAIKKASYAKGADDKKHCHQYRLRNSTLEKVESGLFKSKTKIESCTTFDELFHFLEDEIGKIDGVGPLMIYDTALRLGAKLGLKPEKVYLHAGTRSGAKALGLDCKNKIIEIEKFPEPIQQLEPYEIEDFLCIYKDDLKSVK